MSFKDEPQVGQRHENVERNWEYYRIIISLNELKDYMMVIPEIKYAGDKLVPRSDFRVGTDSIRNTSKEISPNIGTWKVRSLRPAGRLENLTSGMDKCELNVVGLGEVLWTGKGKILSGKNTMFYSSGVKAETVLQQC
jgi:hypothetical protein